MGAFLIMNIKSILFSLLFFTAGVVACPYTVVSSKSISIGNVTSSSTGDEFYVQHWVYTTLSDGSDMSQLITTTLTDTQVTDLLKARANNPAANAFNRALNESLQDEGYVLEDGEISYVTYGDPAYNNGVLTEESTTPWGMRDYGFGGASCPGASASVNYYAVSLGEITGDMLGVCGFTTVTTIERSCTIGGSTYTYASAFVSGKAESRIECILANAPYLEAAHNSYLTDPSPDWNNISDGESPLVESELSELLTYLNQDSWKKFLTTSAGNPYPAFFDTDAAAAGSDAAACTENPEETVYDPPPELSESKPDAEQSPSGSGVFGTEAIAGSAAPNKPVESELDQLIETVSDTLDETIVSNLDSIGAAGLDDFEDSFISSLGSGDSPISEPTDIGDMITGISAFNPSACEDLTTDVLGKTDFTITCSGTQNLRDVLAFVVSVYTLFYIFGLAVNSPRSEK